MAQYLKRMKQHVCAFCISMLVFNVQAEVLLDPTKPPFTMLSPAALTQVVDVAEPVLQSVTLGSEIKSAMISGESVLLGEQYQDFQLVKISTTQVVLQGNKGRRKTLKLSYPVQKKRLKQQLKSVLLEEHASHQK